MKAATARAAATWLLLALVAGCAGTGRGMIRDGGDALFDWKDDMNGSVLSAILPDGERFEGKFVEAQSAGTQTFGTRVYDPKTKKMRYETATGTSRDYSGQIEAVLFGDRGHSMRCRFLSDSPGSGLAAGAVGSCEVSDGRTIDVQF